MTSFKNPDKGTTNSLLQLKLAGKIVASLADRCIKVSSSDFYCLNKMLINLTEQFFMAKKQVLASFFQHCCFIHFKF